MNILFMGTPDIAAAALTAILEAGHTVCGVYTRADKPVGRKQVLTPPPVKQAALAHGLPVFQPKTLRDGVAEEIRKLSPDLIVVVAYGRILPPEVLAIPPRGCINLHVSLLPQYRGAAPVQWAVINGDKETGVSIMYLNEGLDTGDILRVEPIAIGENETAGELFERITETGAKTLLAAIDEIAAGAAHAVPQDDAKATLAPPLTKEMALFDFGRPARKLHDLIRGLNPWPAAYFRYGGKKVKVLRTLCDDAADGAPGEILCTKPLKVACAGGALTLLEVVPEGSRPMEGSAWAAGRRFSAGDRLAETE
ncbi:MAG: methionyl-tRNA formyltransferase [Subdoligranulum sp.]|nr:methionyl-tRNA formyltransferase [Subdoligranulum sp.]